MAQYIDHYEAQLGGGGMDNFYRGARHQRGHGIGSFLGGLFRRILPLFTSGARAVGKEALRTGMNVINDMQNNTPFKQALKTRAKESGRNLQKKAEEKLDKLMHGSGYKAMSGELGRQLMLARVNRLTSARAARKKGGIRKKKTTTKKKTKKKKKTKAKKAARTSRTAAGKSGKRMKRAVTDIFGPG